MGQNRFTSKFQDKSISELEGIANNKESFEEEARLAASWLLDEKRGATEETKMIAEEIHQKRQEEIQKAQKNQELEKKEKYQTDDIAAPELYTKKTVFILSILFSPLVGVVLLIMNFNRLKNRVGITQVVQIGLAYIVLVVFASNFLEIKPLQYVINFGGAYLVSEWFWNRKIGKKTLHRPRSWIKPAIISAILSAGVLYLIMQGY
jgi:cation transport ATPase